MPVHVTEYAGIGLSLGGVVPIYDYQQKVAHQKITVGNASSAFNARTTLISVKADEDCYIEIGASASASTSTEFMSAGDRIDFFIDRGAGWILDTNATS